MTNEIGTWSDIPENVRTALHKAQDYTRRSTHITSAVQARTYILAIPVAIAEFGQRGLKTQLLYVLGNLNGWRGEDAKYSKNVIKNFIATL